MAKGTVMVNLKKDWFDGQSLYQAADNPHEFPASYAEKPKQAEDESEEAWKARQKRQPYAVLPSSAEVLDGNVKTVVVLHDTANGEQVEVATAVPDDVESVGGALNDKGREVPDQPVAQAAKAADEANAQVGGKPRESGPLPAGAQKHK